MKIIWVGFHEEGKHCIPEIYRAGFTLEAIITLNDEQLAKRSGVLNYDHIAKKYAIPVYKIAHINDDSSLSLFSKLSPDVICVIGWSQILNKQVLNSAKLVIGGHASLLPHNRGSAPINWAIINGEETSGNTLMQLQEGVDTGSILAQKKFNISLFDSCKTLYEKVAISNAKMLVRVLKDFASHRLLKEPQKPTDEKILPRRTPADGLVNWSASSIDVYNFIRALAHPYPGAHSFINGEMIKIWEASWCNCDQKNGKAATIADFRYSFNSNQCATLINCEDGCIAIHKAERESGIQLIGEDLINYFISLNGFDHK